MASTPPLRLPYTYTIRHHQHIYIYHRIKERLAGFIQITATAVLYQFFLLRLSPIFNLLIDYMRRNITKFKRSLCCNLYRFSHVRLSPFCNLLIYLLSISFIGFFLLKALHFELELAAIKDIDMLFTAVSAATLSSLTTVEMEVFSNSQLIVLTILIVAGGEAFISLLALQFKRFTLKRKLISVVTEQNLTELVHPIGVGDTELKPDTTVTITVNVLSDDDVQSDTTSEMKYSAIVYLSYVVLSYLLVMHIGGTVTMLAYLYSVSDARSVLTEKGINSLTFSVFATVSSFTNCGFLPTNESMAVFKNELGLLLLVVPQSLLGGALYPPALRSVLWLLKRMTKHKTSEYILREGEQMQIGYEHLFPWLHSVMLLITVLGILLLQFAAICAMEWRSNMELRGLNVYQKLVNNLFMAVNARHTGESTVDLATLTPAVLVLFVFIMYLPPYTTFMPFKDESSKKDKYCKQESIIFFKIAHFSQLFYLVIFVMIICITEKEKISQDPLNFNIFSIVFEVVSAHGNVGYSMGYSCSRRLTEDGGCQDSWTSFAGRWSTSGKVVLILVMLLGGLKRYTITGPKPWKFG